MAMRWLWHVLRKRAVLCCVFVGSLTYFLVKTGIAGRVIGAVWKTGDVEERMLDGYKLTMQRQIRWLADAGSTPTAAQQQQQPGMGIDANETLLGGIAECRNTRQGATYVTDDRGYTCERGYLMLNGCCDAVAMSRGSKGSPAPRFSCEGCQADSGCCQNYESCVSCCLKPDQKSILLDMIMATSGHRLRQILAARDQFELCLLKCRTSSSSVHSENKYKSETFKYCYKQEQAVEPFRR